VKPFCSRARAISPVLLDYSTHSDTIALEATAFTTVTDRHNQDPRQFLPLSASVLHVLLALADGDKHGYAIIKEVRRRTGGEVELGASSLYSVLKRMVADGLVLETAERPDPALDDERRRYYTLTSLGRAVAIAELRRLESILVQGRAKRLLLNYRRG
jgi:DNA-binding PadR family transcriptional regulator